jgi:phosphohistidine phosphatase
LTDTREIVAAVCYRRDGADVEFLIVQTSRLKRWTFPKGHVEAGESPSVAAAREAREEAGVDGVISDQPFTRYRYPSGKSESIVSAFLLEMATVGEQRDQDGHRERVCVGPDGAVDLLTARRKKKYADEHERVVREALAQLRR